MDTNNYPTVLRELNVSSWTELLDYFNKGWTLCHWCREWVPVTYKIPDRLCKYVRISPVYDYFANVFGGTAENAMEHNEACSYCISAAATSRNKITKRTYREKTGHLETWSSGGKYEGGPGHTYLVNHSSGNIKIGGTTKSVRGRMQVTPGLTSFIHAIYSRYPFKLEKALHHKFRSQHAMKIDYFDLTDVDIAYIKAIKSINGLPVKHIDAV